MGYGIIENGGVGGRETCRGLGRSAPGRRNGSPESMREELEMRLEQGEPRAERQMMRMEGGAAGQVTWKDLGF